MDLIDKENLDAVPVVRCKDCYWSHEYKGHMHCSFVAFDVRDDFYCAHGKKKETDR